MRPLESLGRGNGAACWILGVILAMENPPLSEDLRLDQVIITAGNHKPMNPGNKEKSLEILTFYCSVHLLGGNHQIAKCLGLQTNTGVAIKPVVFLGGGSFGGKDKGVASHCTAQIPFC